MCGALSISIAKSLEAVLAISHVNSAESTQSVVQEESQESFVFENKITITSDGVMEEVKTSVDKATGDISKHIITYRCEGSDLKLSIQDDKWFGNDRGASSNGNIYNDNIPDDPAYYDGKLTPSDIYVSFGWTNYGEVASVVEPPASEGFYNEEPEPVLGVEDSGGSSQSN